MTPELIKAIVGGIEELVMFGVGVLIFLGLLGAFDRRD